MRATAIRHGALLVDVALERAFHDRRVWHADRLHLAAAGHVRVPAAVLEALGVTDPDRLGGKPDGGVSTCSRPGNHLFTRGLPPTCAGLPATSLRGSVGGCAERPAVTVSARNVPDGSDAAQCELEALARALDKERPGAAASLRERLADALTVERLGVTGSLLETVESTKPVESMIEIVRHPSAG